MRVAGIIDESQAGNLTDSGATVGEFTLGGTLELLIITSVFGVFGGILYLGIRRWIPSSFVPKGLTFGAAVLIVPGATVFNEDNPDLQIFEPVLLILPFFWVLFLLYGTIVARLAHELHPEAPRTLPPTRRNKVIEALMVVVLVSFNIAVAVGIKEHEGTCLAPDGVGGCAIPASQR